MAKEFKAEVRLTEGKDPLRASGSYFRGDAVLTLVKTQAAACMAAAINFSTMKPFHELSHTDKAKLLHELFPSEIPALLEFIQGMCAAIKEDQSRNRNSWDNAFITFDFWLELIEQAESVFAVYHSRLHTSSKLFAQHLFYGHICAFTIHCIRNYVTVKRHPHQKFVKAADLLFND